MFIDFFFNLRTHKIPVTPGEFLDFLTALEQLLPLQGIPSSLTFYQVARSCLIKDIKYFDAYDLCFAKTFKDSLGADNSLSKQIEEWLKNPMPNELTDEKKQAAPHFPPEELLNELRKRLEQQKKRHQGGSHWIGTGGTSPFGNGGYNPGGVRIGGISQSQSGLASALNRQYRQYRTDETLNVRQFKMALKKLRGLKKVGQKKLSIPKTIQKTCAAGGELELVLECSRRNEMKLLLLMDVGGSMTPYAQLVNRLFSACHQLNHFKEFKSYYFHNIFYDYLYQDAHFNQPVSIDAILRKYPSNTRIIIVGDGAMAPYELFSMTQGMMDFYSNLSSSKNSNFQQKKQAKTGLNRIQQLIQSFSHVIWLNPEPPSNWFGQTTQAIGEKIPMFFLGLEGLQKGIQRLL